MESRRLASKETRSGGFTKACVNALIICGRTTAADSLIHAVTNRLPRNDGDSYRCRQERREGLGIFNLDGGSHYVRVELPF